MAIRLLPYPASSPPWSITTPDRLTLCPYLTVTRRHLAERTWQDRAAYLERQAEQRASEQRRQDALAIDAYLDYLAGCQD